MHKVHRDILPREILSGADARMWHYY